MRLIGALIVACLLIAACAQEAPEEFKCNTPYIQRGSDCCLDQNTNNICDEDENVAEPEEETAPEPEPEEEVAQEELSYEDKELLATNFAKKMARDWEQGAWEDVYEYIPAGEQEALAKDDFVFFMTINDYDYRAQHDQEFQDAIYDNWLYNVDNSEKTKMTIGNVNVIGDTAIAFADVTYKGVPVEWDSFSFVLEGNEWKVQTMGVFFNGNDVDSICPETNYEERCYFSYAEHTDDKTYCDKAGVFLAECYAALGEDVSTEQALASCNAYELGSQHDECLKEVVLDSKDVSLCDNMKMSQNIYICRGNIAGFDEDLDSCLSTITDTGTTAEIREAQCRYGYVETSKDSSVCKGIGENAADIKENCYNIR